MNESSIDPPIVPNKVLQQASKIHTPTDQEVLMPSPVRSPSAISYLSAQKFELLTDIKGRFLLNRTP